MLKITSFISTLIIVLSNSFAIANPTILTSMGSISLNGTTDQVILQNDISLGEDFTISTWINTSSDQSSAVQTIISKGDQNNGWNIQLNESNEIQVTFYNEGAATQMISNHFLSYDVWRQITLTYTDDSLKIYVDGILDSVQYFNLSDQSQNLPLIIGAANSSTPQHFKGSIDEVRVFNRALTVEQIRFFMNQELVNENDMLAGAIIKTSSNNTSALPWSSLITYLTFNNGTAADLSASAATLDAQHSSFTTNNQSAPLPYISIQNGNWNASDTWDAQGSIHAPGSYRIMNGEQVRVTWNIVNTYHDIIVSEKTELLALELKANTIKVQNDQALTINGFLQLNGTLDLENESQLIQTSGSELDPSSTGKIERDQQGTGNKYNYNYWSSPVSYTGVNEINGGFDLSAVMMDGTNPSVPKPLNFTNPNDSDGAPATESQAATVSSKWIHKYANLTSGTYANWQFVGNTGKLKAGEAYSMKGTGCSTDQNYTFMGLPNNGPIELTANAGNDYLVGNPYPSAMDAAQFIADNPLLDGTIYFWEHVGGESHSLANYEGGYSMYNLSGGTPNPTIGTSDALMNNDGKQAKLPGRYIPVAQGFFVVVKDDGAIKFNNAQRVFEKEASGNSVFVAAPGSNYNPSLATYQQHADERTKIRIGFDSPNLIHRQLLLTIDPNATTGYDRGYDGLQFDDQMDDMAFWVKNERLSIQGIGIVDDAVELPLYVKLSDHGTIKIGLDHIENLDPDQPVFLKDAVTGELHNLREGKFESPFLFRGQYKTRFSIIFHGKSTLSNETLDDQNNILVFTPQGTNAIHIKTPENIQLDEVVLINMLGQQVKSWNISTGSKEIILPRQSLASGNYIVTMKSDGQDYQRKVILK
ncbi:LamG-like jellyroll fold domain-containing protein [Nonlabens sp. YIK11]|uniref:LamG-like jellyroll fold domain-containing protein n=1 Tax=Nonlabens sp. YIK11 TaxID=1453349 RepID=UPI0009E94FE7|nr:LamG-like jellyroll fold domain-containing protein [Nonlabens sp. YIK11]